MTRMRQTSRPSRRASSEDCAAACAEALETGTARCARRRRARYTCHPHRTRGIRSYLRSKSATLAKRYLLAGQQKCAR